MQKILNCDYCGKEFRRVPSQIRINKNHFCSKECYGKWASINRIGVRSNHYKAGVSLTKGYRHREHKRNDEYDKKYRLENKLHYREYDLKRKYKIDISQYNLMLESQGWKCKICGVNFKDINKSFSIDHDHNCCSGEVTCGRCLRGLLCSKCNHLLGNANDSIDILSRSITYLEGYRGKN